MPAARSSGATARSIVKNSKRRAKFEHAMKKREEELEAWFNTYDTNKDQRMDREEMRNVLQAAIKTDNPDGEVEPIPESVLDEVMKFGDVYDQGAIRRDKVLESVIKYKGLLRTHKVVTDLLARHDKDQSGSLSPEELLPLLQEVAPPPYKHADMGDVDFVMKVADKDGSGTLELSELECAVGTWLEVAPSVPPEENSVVEESKKTSSACSIL